MMKKDDPNLILLDEKEAAPVSGLAVRTLQQRRYQGLPPKYIKIPGTRSIRYRLSDLLAFRDEGLVDPEREGKDE